MQFSLSLNLPKLGFLRVRVIDSLLWCLNGNGKFDTWFFYNEARDFPNSTFPWKGVRKVKVPKMVAFFL